MSEHSPRASGRVAGRKVKVTDVARLAGVSPSTVDRVLNSRAGVRPETVRLVEAAMVDLGYVASSLAGRLTGAVSTIDVVLPRGTNPFFQALKAEFEDRGRQLAEAGLQVRVADTDVFDTGSMTSFLRAYAPDPGRALVLVAHEAPEVRQAIDELTALGVVVITLISDSTRSGRKAFIGIDNFAAGRTAGALMARFLGAQSGRIGMLVGHLGLRDHLDRRSGFEQAMAELRPDCDLRLIGASRDADAQAEELIRSALDKHPDIVGLYNTGAANAGLFKALRVTGGSKRIVIAHELTAENRLAMIDGVCDALIVQDVREAARRALEAAASGARQLRGVDAPMMIGIMIKENLPWATAL